MFFSILKVLFFLMLVYMLFTFVVTALKIALLLTAGYAVVRILLN